LRILGVACPEDDSVWLVLAKQLFDCFKALNMSVFVLHSAVVWGLTIPDETPVATIVFAREDISTDELSELGELN
jgi:hypothetical protein